MRSPHPPPPRARSQRLEASLKTALADQDLQRRFAELAADIPQPDQIGRNRFGG